MPPLGWGVMLELTRRKYQGIVLNNDIFLTVVDIRRDTARLGIESPKETSIHTLPGQAPVTKKGRRGRKRKKD